jgi:hypothetical protein
MSAGSGTGFVVNIFAVGFILIPVLAMWDRFILTSNTLMTSGLMDQDGMNAMYALTIMINAIAFIFLLAGSYGLIVQAKSDASRQV